MSGLRILIAFGWLCTLTNVGFCDLAPIREPLPKPPLLAPVKIVEQNALDRDPNVAAKIVIPKSMLSELKEQSGPLSGSNESAAGASIFVGLALSAAAISVMFALRNSPRRRAGLTGLIACVVVAAFVSAWIVFGPASNRTSSANGPANRHALIAIEIQEQGHEVILMVRKAE